MTGETPLESPSAIPEYTAEEERADSKHWKAVWIGDKQFRIDMKVVEPYKKVLSHGGNKVRNTEKGFFYIPSF